jgi:hypothetical protein
MFLTAFADVRGPPEAVPIIVGIIESPAEGLSEFARSNLLQHGRQALTKIDPKVVGNPSGCGKMAPQARVTLNSCSTEPPHLA